MRIPNVRFTSNTSRLALCVGKKIKGEFRADPRLDVFDLVVVESKYGYVFPVVITDIKYSFNGSFNATYEGRVLTTAVESAIGSFVIGASTLGGAV